MHRSYRLPLLLAFLLIGAVCMSLTTMQIVAQDETLTSLPSTEQALLPSAPAHGVPTKTRRSRRSQIMLAAITTESPKANTIRPVIDQPDITLRHKQIAEEMLRILPSECQGALKSFYVRYDNPKQRGLAGKSSVIVSGSVPDDEYRALLAHEFGHLMDLGCKTGTAQSGDSGFRDGNEVIYNDDPSVAFYSISWKDSKTKNRGSTPADYVSGYAQWDPFEDLAETVAAYELHRGALVELASKNNAIAKKVQWIETYLFPQGLDAATSDFVWQQKHPWDITKLAYSWTANLQW